MILAKGIASSNDPLRRQVPIAMSLSILILAFLPTQNSGGVSLRTTRMSWCCSEAIFASDFDWPKSDKAPMCQLFYGMAAIHSRLDMTE
jgi:hypothetical protein